MLKRLAAKWLDFQGYVVFDPRSPQHHYAHDGLLTSHKDRFRDDPAFRAAYARGVAASDGFDPKMEWRVHVALWAARAATRAAGHFVECGVNAGFVSSAIMQRLDWRNIGKRFYLIDTFAGPVLSQYSPKEAAEGRVRMAEDALSKGAYLTVLERVRANFAEWPGVEIVQGAVPGVLPSLGIDQVAFLHIDMNCAYPERAALVHFWSLLSPGALVLLDDYAYVGFDALAEAIDSAAALLGAEILSLPTGQGLIMKP